MPDALLGPPGRRDAKRCTRASSHGRASALLPLKPICGTPGGPLCCCGFSALGALTALADTYISAELKGNKQAQDIKAGVGSLGGLKKSL